MADFRMPSLGADMDEGVLIEWLVKVGDVVHRGDVVAVVETPKSAVEVETFDDGTVQELRAEEGQTVPVGGVLATIADPHVPERPPAGTPSKRRAEPRERSRRKSTRPPDHRKAAAPTEAQRAAAEDGAVEPVSAALADAPPLQSRHTPSPVLRHRARQLGVDVAAVMGSGPDGEVTRADIERVATRPPARLRVSPLARRLAREQGVDVASLTGTGPEGSIRAGDVGAAVAVAAVATTSADGQQPARRPTEAPSAGTMRESIATLMSRSNQEIPHYYLSHTVDMDTAVEWVRQRNRELGMEERLVPAALMLVATARAAQHVPELNGHWVHDGFQPSEDVRLGLVLSLRSGGLLVPTIVGADHLSVSETMQRIRELTRRARSGRLRSSELLMPSITVSNLGDQGVDSVNGVIYPPQVALVGFGAIAERPWAVGGLLGVRPLVTVTLAGDHRATDGATGARFLKTIDRLLQRPEEL